MVDLHVHYPMHLLGGVEDPRDVPRGMFKVLRARGGQAARGGADVAARLLNFRHWDGGWRATLPLLEQGEVTVACSVLYRPFSELDLDEPYGAPPESAYFGKLIELLEATEREIERAGHTVVRSAEDLQGERASSSCTASRAASTSAPRRPRSTPTSANWLAAASSTSRSRTSSSARSRPTRPPSPSSPTPSTTSLFPQHGGLSPLGEAAVKAMNDTGIIVDISHMRERRRSTHLRAARRTTRR